MARGGQAQEGQGLLPRAPSQASWTGHPPLRELPPSAQPPWSPPRGHSKLKPVWPGTQAPGFTANKPGMSSSCFPAVPRAGQPPTGRGSLFGKCVSCVLAPLSREGRGVSSPLFKAGMDRCREDSGT